MSCYPSYISFSSHWPLPCYCATLAFYGQCWNDRYVIIMQSEVLNSWKRPLYFTVTEGYIEDKLVTNNMQRTRKIALLFSVTPILLLYLFNFQRSTISEEGKDNSLQYDYTTPSWYKDIEDNRMLVTWRPDWYNAKSIGDVMETRTKRIKRLCKEYRDSPNKWTTQKELRHNEILTSGQAEICLTAKGGSLFWRTVFKKLTGLHNDHTVGPNKVSRC